MTKNKSHIAFIAALLIFTGLSSFLLWDRSRLRAEVEALKVDKEHRALAVIENAFASLPPVESQEAVMHAKKDQYMQEGKKFVFADLETLDIWLYDGAAPPQHLKIKTKGREGSWWETPSGEYTALLRSRAAFSSLGNVWMPYAIQFYGNFFIHGWPYYENGKDVASTYSGGCIRMATEDAKIVYEFVESGMPILIIGERDQDNFLGLKTINNTTPLSPEIQAESALVANPVTGEVYLNKSAESILPMASIAKLMTALVASEVINMDRSVRVSQSALTTSPIQSYALTTGNSYKIFDLLYPMLEQSSNGAAESIAGFIGKSEFVRLMNKKATALGMINTQFADPAGVREENMSTAKDLLFMSRYILEKRRFIYQITKGENNLPWGYSPLGEIQNTNDFHDLPEVIGVKIGKTTAAKETGLFLLDMKPDDGIAPVAIIILNSPGRRQDAEVLMNWLKANFKPTDV